MSHFVAPQQNNRKWQIFLIIASLGGGGWAEHQLLSAPGAVHIHHEEETGPQGLLKDLECILWDSGAEGSEGSAVTGALLEVQPDGK